MPEVLSNQPLAGTLASGITSGATTATLTTGHGAARGYPATGTYRVAMYDATTGANYEIATVASRSGDVLTFAARGQEGFSPAAHNPGDPVDLILTTGALQAVFAPFDVRFYGAVGDGVADDTAAIQAAITAANAAGGGRVTLQAGTYLFTTLAPKADVELTGAGMWATTLKQVNATNATLMTATSAHRFVLRDLTVDGNKANNTGAGNWSGLFLTTSDDARVHRCRFVNVDWIAVALAGCQRGDVAECLIDSPDYIGVWLGTSGATHCTGTRVIRNTILDTGLDAVIAGTDDLLVAENYCRGSGRITHASGVYVPPGYRRVRVEGNHCEGTSGHGVDFDTSSTDDSYGCVAVGNVCVRNRDAGIGCDSNGALLVGNYCEGNGYAQGTAGAYPYGIIADAKYVVVVGNRCTDVQGTKTQTYGISLRNVSTVTDQCTFVGNDLTGNTNAGINALTTIGTGHVSVGNRGAPDLLRGNLAVNSTTSDHKVVLESAANDHLRLIRTGSGYLYETYIDSTRVWYFAKPTGNTGSSLNALFKFGVIGGLDSINPYWNGVQFQGHTVTEVGVNTFPIMGFYSRSAAAADPTDYEFVFELANAGTLPGSMQYRLPDVAGGYVRWRFGNTERLRLARDGTVTMTAALAGPEIADPAAPATNNGLLYFRDNGSGKTQLVARFPTGAIQIIATEP